MDRRRKTIRPWPVKALLKLPGAGYLFVTVDVMDNPYDMLPSYWPQFTADVSAHNLSAVPEPSSAAMLLAALGVLAWRVRRTASVGG